MKGSWKAKCQEALQEQIDDRESHSGKTPERSQLLQNCSV